MLFIIFSMLLFLFSIVMMFMVFSFFSTLNVSTVVYSLLSFNDWTMLSLKW